MPEQDNEQILPVDSDKLPDLVMDQHDDNLNDDNNDETIIYDTSEFDIRTVCESGNKKTTDTTAKNDSKKKGVLVIREVGLKHHGDKQSHS